MFTKDAFNNWPLQNTAKRGLHNVCKNQPSTTSLSDNTYLYIQLYIIPNSYTHICTYIYIHIHIYTYIHIHIYTYIHIYYTYTYICIYIIYISYIHIHIYTHIYLNIRRLWPVLDIRGMAVSLGEHFFIKRAFCLLAPPKQMSFLNIFPKKFFFQNSRYYIYYILYILNIYIYIYILYIYIIYILYIHTYIYIIHVCMLLLLLTLFNVEIRILAITQKIAN